VSPEGLGPGCPGVKKKTPAKSGSGWARLSFVRLLARVYLVRGGGTRATLVGGSSFMCHNSPGLIFGGGGTHARVQGGWPKGPGVGWRADLAGVGGELGGIPGLGGRRFSARFPTKHDFLCSSGRGARAVFEGGVTGGADRPRPFVCGPGGIVKVLGGKTQLGPPPGGGCRGRQGVGEKRRARPSLRRGGWRPVSPTAATSFACGQPQRERGDATWDFVREAEGGRDRDRVAKPPTNPLGWGGRAAIRTKAVAFRGVPCNPQNKPTGAILGHTGPAGWLCTPGEGFLHRGGLIPPYR